MGLDNYLLGTSAGVPSFSDQPSGGSARLVGLVRTNRNDDDQTETAPVAFAEGTDPVSYDFLDLSLNTQAFGPLPTNGIGITDGGEIIIINTAALNGPLEGGLY
jgi:hypothetical protein